MIKSGYEPSGASNRKPILVNAPDKPTVESPSTVTPRAARNGAGLFPDAGQWVCDCGQTCDPVSPDWRWNGRDWCHHHGYPVGHVQAQRKP